MNKNYDYLFKVVLIGNTNVGKSSILLRFADDKFTETYMTTIGVDFRFKILNIDNKKIKFQIWDTAGQERYRAITSAYYRGADAIGLVYDITNKESLNNIKDWVRDVILYTDKDIKKILIGNKNDKERIVSEEEGRQMAKEINSDYVETSAKSGKNIEDMFIELGRELINKRIKENEEIKKEVIKINEKINKNDKKCC